MTRHRPSVRADHIAPVAAANGLTADCRGEGIRNARCLRRFASMSLSISAPADLPIANGRPRKAAKAA